MSEKSTNPVQDWLDAAASTLSHASLAHSDPLSLEIEGEDWFVSGYARYNLFIIAHLIHAEDWSSTKMLFLSPFKQAKFEDISPEWRM